MEKDKHQPPYYSGEVKELAYYFASLNSKAGSRLSSANSDGSQSGRGTELPLPPGQ